MLHSLIITLLIRNLYLSVAGSSIIVTAALRELTHMMSGWLEGRGLL